MDGRQSVTTVWTTRVILNGLKISDLNNYKKLANRLCGQNADSLTL
jgi:hypothetical protein